MCLRRANYVKNRYSFFKLAATGARGKRLRLKKKEKKQQPNTHTHTHTHTHTQRGGGGGNPKVSKTIDRCNCGSDRMKSLNFTVRNSCCEW